VKKLLPAIVAALVCAAPCPAELVIGLMPAINSVPLVAAAERGWFAAEGVRVTLTLFQSQMYREAALQSHAIDGTVSDLINAVQGWSRGAGTMVTSVSEGGFGLLAAPGSRIQDLAGWKALGARKVPTGLLEASIVFYVTERLLEAAGADPSSIELVPIVQVPVRLEMLLAGQVEAACLPEPLATAGVRRGARLLADSAQLGREVGVLLFTGKALVEKRAEIAAFYRAYDRAVAELARDPGAFRDAIVRECGFPPGLGESLRLPRFRRAFLPLPADVSDVAQWMRGKGLVGKVPAYGEVVCDWFAARDARDP
jgi:NitT/TauT family transport system substrate-binding protein